MEKQKNKIQSPKATTQITSNMDNAFQSFLAYGGIIRRGRIRLFLIILSFSLLISLLVSGHGSSTIPTLIAGTYSQKSVRAPYDFELIDEEATEKKRVQAINQSPPVLDYDPDVLKPSIEKLRKAFQALKSLYLEAVETPDAANGQGKPDTTPAESATEAPKEPLPPDPQKLQEAESQFGEIQNLSLDKSDFNILRSNKYHQKIYKAILTLLDSVKAYYIAIDRPELFAQLKSSFPDSNSAPKLQIRNTHDKTENTLTDLTKVIDLATAEKIISENIRKLDPGESTILNAVIEKIARALIQPNAGVNVEETQARKQRAAQEVIPVLLVYKKNQLIVGEGHIVTEDQAKVLQWIVSRESLELLLLKIAGLSLLLAVLIFTAFTIIVVNFPDMQVRDKDFIFIGFLLLVTIGVLRLFMALGEILAEREYGFPPMALTLLFPFAASAMLVRFIFRFELALVFAVCAALINGLTVQLDYPMSIYFFISSLAGVHFMGGATRRADIVKAGLYVGFVNLALVGCMILFVRNFDNVLALSFYSLAGGFLCGLFVVALTPLAEWIFGYMTPVALQELASYEHPLLREIMTKTPGTFQHSVTIGTLAEAAAESIGADALLCRVGALFHDSGKSLNPDWFVENQSRTNPHDELNDPYKSAAIIKKHVSDGVALARRHHLGERLIDFIREHHGTSTIKYFMSKAIDAADGDIDKIDQSAFVYDGPRPRSRETGILMIADAIEAISRTLKDRSREAMRNMIDKTISRLQVAGQLANTPLTQKDLSTISESFCRVLTGSHHTSINYEESKN